MSEELNDRFEQAVEDAQHLPSRPDNDTLLRLYALYKQATIGDASGKRPGITAFVGRAKFDAWAKFKGTSRDEAMNEYASLVGRLKKG